MALLGELLNAAPLVSVVGLGGIGKTRLAIEAAREATREYSGGHWFVDLEASRSRDELILAVAAALGMKPDPLDSVAAMRSALAGLDPTLLLLDNCEQLEPDATRELSRWLDTNKALTLLVTSRHRLKLSGERVVELTPLAPEQARSLFLDVCLELGHVTVDGGFDETELGALLTWLEGLPLAIRLAAAQIDLMGPGELVERLRSRHDLLESSFADSAPRHETMDSAIDTSWALLREPERRGLAALSVFPGDFDARAAEAVMAGVVDAPLEVLRTLRERSLVRRDPTGSADTPRFSLFGAVRRFASARLDDGADGPAVRRRHAEHVVALARPAPLEQPNLKAALDWLLDCGDDGHLELGAACLESLAAIWHEQGLTSNDRALIERAIDTVAGRPALEAAARIVRGRFLARGGPQNAARDELEAALDLARRARDEGLQAQAELWLGDLAFQAADWPLADRHYTAALDRFRSSADDHGTGLLELRVAGLRAGQRRLEEADDLFRSAHDTLTRGGFESDAAIALNNGGLVLQEQGQLEAARLAFESAVAVHRQFGNTRFEGFVECDLGRLALEAGFAVAAEAHFRAALPLLRRVGETRYVALCSAALAAGLACLARPDEARDFATEADTLAALTSDLSTTRTIDVYRCHLELASALSAQAGGDGTALPRACEAGATEIRQKPSQRIVAALVDARLTGSDWIEASTLISAGWPGERILEKAARNRLHVALNRLRKGGLDAFLERDGARYRLRPSAAVLVIASA